MLKSDEKKRALRMTLLAKTKGRRKSDRGPKKAQE